MRRVVRVWRAGLVVEVGGAYGAGRPSPLLASCGCRNGLQRERERERDRQTEKAQVQAPECNTSQEVLEAMQAKPKIRRIKHLSKASRV